MDDGSKQDNNTDRLCGTGFTEQDFQDGLYDHLRSAGVNVERKRTEPFGNEDCVCGSGIRYDMCCSKKKLNDGE